MRVEAMLCEEGKHGFVRYDPPRIENVIANQRYAVITGEKQLPVALLEIAAARIVLYERGQAGFAEELSGSIGIFRQPASNSNGERGFVAQNACVLARRDLPELVRHAAGLQLYTNVITSGVLLTDKAMAALREAKVDHIQLSFQDCEEATANEYAGTRAHAKKLELAEMIRRSPLAFTMNAVVHRGNLDRLDRIIAMAEELGPTLAAWFAE